MKLWAWLLSLGADDPELLDHVPVTPKTLNAKKFARARAKARERHGKPFTADTIKERETPKSRQLQEIEAASAASTIVVPENPKVRRIG